MRRIYMRFERSLEVWRVTLMERGLPLREYTFADGDKVEEMAKRGGGLRSLADIQALEMAVRNGRGGVELQLTDEQYARLRR